MADIEPAAERMPSAPAAPRRGDDRYGSLLDGLRGTSGIDAPGGSAPPRAEQGGWHPIALRLVILALVLAALYLATVTGMRLLREGRVDTWAGPDASVQSGQHLAGCPEAEAIVDEIFPSWIRYGGVVYALTDAITPIGLETGVGETGYTESGYTLGTVRLLLDDVSPQGRARDRILVLAPPGRAGQWYLRTGCR